MALRALERPTGYTRPWMDPLDHLVALPDGLPCSVCEERVPATRIRLLARRDDLAFLEIDCDACGNATLGFVVAGEADAPRDHPAAIPVSADDVLDMHQLLATWHGDLAGLLSHDPGAGRRLAGDRGSAGSNR